MKSSLQLYIPKPCHENWDAMHPTKQGRFCDSCAKQVIDFSLMTDAEVLNYFKNSNGKTCGRFTEDQLGRILEPTKMKRKKTWQWLLATTITFFLGVRKAISQKNETLKSDNVNVVMKGNKSELGEVVVVGKVKAIVTKKKESIEIVKDDSVSGKIVDEKNNPIPYASILIKNTNRGTTSNAIGEFELNIKGFAEKIDIVVMALGYEQEERTIMLESSEDDHLVQLKQVNNVLTEVKIVSGEIIRCTRRFLGDVIAVDSKPSRKDTSLAAVRNALDNSLFTIVENPLKVYPNPVAKNSTLNIEIGISGNIQIQLLDMNGKLMMYEEVHNISKKQIVQLPLSMNITTGMYFVKIIEPEKQKQYAEKIIIR